MAKRTNQTRNDFEPVWHQQMRWCIHFTGLIEPRCKLGIAYESVRDANVQPYYYPCLGGLPEERTGTTICPHCVYLSEGEAKAKEAELKAHTRQFFGKLQAGICPHCDQVITERVQVGPCVYAEPCGHRLYQGRTNARLARGS